MIWNLYYLILLLLSICGTYYVLRPLWLFIIGVQYTLDVYIAHTSWAWLFPGDMVWTSWKGFNRHRLKMSGGTNFNPRAQGFDLLSILKPHQQCVVCIIAYIVYCFGQFNQEGKPMEVNKWLIRIKNICINMFDPKRKSYHVSFY